MKQLEEEIPNITIKLETKTVIEIKYVVLPPYFKTQHIEEFFKVSSEGLIKRMLFLSDGYVLMMSDYSKSSISQPIEEITEEDYNKALLSAIEMMKT
jgi:hypothetical protein